MCCGRVARQWTPEHGAHHTGKVFLRRGKHTELMHCTQSLTHLYACVHEVFGVVRKYIYKRLCNRSTKGHARVEAEMPKIKDVW